MVIRNMIKKLEFLFGGVGGGKGGCVQSSHIIGHHIVLTESISNCVRCQSIP